MVRLFILLFPFMLFSEEPWGTAQYLLETKLQASTSPVHFIILFHQQVLSEADGPRSHFYPSSSEYTRRAICKQGALIGFFLGCDRLMRENSDPWLYPKKRLKSGILLKSDSWGQA